jgi:uncharacterized membrane protein YqhA
MSRLFAGTRFLILIPIIGLAFAAALFFVFGGFGLIRLGFDTLAVTFDPNAEQIEHGLLMYEVVEYVHTFLVGTVLYITAIGLYQLFIDEVQFHGWLKIETTEELENNLIGVTVVVLAVNFMGRIFTGNTVNLLEVGAAMALPIAALGSFVALRAWANHLGKRHSHHKDTSEAVVKADQAEAEPITPP